jgi:hypothetical protein
MATNFGSDSGDRRGLSPKWSVALFSLVALSPALDLYEAGDVSWLWLVVGVVSWATAAGPVAASEFGRRFGAWFRAIGVVGRAVAIFGFAAAWWWVVAEFDPPEVPLDSFVLGGLGGALLMTLWQQFWRD